MSDQVKHLQPSSRCGKTQPFPPSGLNCHQNRDKGLRTFLNILAAISPILVALLAGVGWLYRHERERREAIERQVSELKYRSYIALLDIFFDLMKATRTGKPMKQRELVDRMVDANKDLMLYGSDDVVRLYHQWQIEMRAGQLDMMRLGQLVVAIRRDMGNATTQITPDDVLRQIITDYDEAKARGDLIQRTPLSTTT